MGKLNEFAKTELLLMIGVELFFGEDDHGATDFQVEEVSWCEFVEFFLEFLFSAVGEFPSVRFVDVVGFDLTSLGFEKSM